MRGLSRWPLLAGASVLLGAAAAIDLSVDGGAALAFFIGGLGAAAAGAFLYAEGARHREWSGQNLAGRERCEDDDTP